MDAFRGQKRPKMKSMTSKMYYLIEKTCFKAFGRTFMDKFKLMYFASNNSGVFGNWPKIVSGTHFMHWDQSFLNCIYIKFSRKISMKVIWMFVSEWSEKFLNIYVIYRKKCHFFVFHLAQKLNGCIQGLGEAKNEIYDRKNV